MVKEEKEKLKNVYGGESITGPVVEGLESIIQLLYGAGKSVGEAIRRLTEGQVCPLTK